MPMSEWLDSLGLGRYASLFAENEIDLEAARHLTAEDLRELGLPMGPRKKLLHAIEALSAAAAIDQSAPRKTDAPSESAERRQVTVMFCDLVGSTKLSVELDPEEMRALLTRYHDAVTRTVIRYEGHVANYLGDGALVYFGWPRAREAQTAEALRAALATIDAVAGLSAPGARRLSARIGVATGEVVVGDLQGAIARQTGAISGEVPNLAARLQAEAGAGEVFIDARTRTMVGGEFELSSLGRRRLKGIADPVDVFRVRREAASDSRFAAQHAGIFSPLVGRRNELGLLEERWATAKEGEGQVVILSGEPGIGKSRLARELLERVAGDQHFRLRYQCSSQHVNSAFYPIIRHLERATTIEPGDSPKRKLDKLEATLLENVADISDAAPVLADLLGLPVERYPERTASPLRQKEMIFDALIGQLVGLCRVKPVLMIVEDAHWIDPTSLEAFGAVATRAQDLPLLLLVTSRPEAEPPWTIGGHISKLSLARLPRAQSMDLARSMIGDGRVDDDLIDQIVARTDGIPLFVEELARTLSERSGGGSGSEIPATLQALLSSRLDQVSPPARMVAQIGSILGREFGANVVRSVGRLSRVEADAALAELVAAGLLIQRSPLTSGVFAFRHALIEEAAYSAQLLALRRERHRLVAEWCEARASAGADVEPEVIAHHFLRADETHRALPHLYAAAKRASGACAFPEAIAHLRAGLDVIEETQARDVKERWRLPFLSGLGTAIMAVRGFADREAGALFQKALEICPADADADTRFPILWNLWLLNQTSANLPEAGRMIATMTPMVGDDAPDLQRLQLSHAGWTTAFSNGDFATAASHLEVGLSIYRAEAHHQSAFHYGGHDPGVCGRCHCGFVQTLTGNLDAGHRCSVEALALADRLAHENSRTIAYAFGALGRFFIRDAASARDLSIEALRLAEQFGPRHFEVLARCVLAWSEEILGERDDGVEQLQAGLDQSQEIGAVMRTPLYALMLGELLNRRGAASQAKATIETALATMKRYHARALAAEAHRLRGEAEIALGEPAAAGASFRKSVDLARRQGARLLELRAQASLVRSGLGQKGTEGAEALSALLGVIEAGRDAPDVVEAKGLLAR